MYRRLRFVTVEVQRRYVEQIDLKSTIVSTFWDTEDSIFVIVDISIEHSNFTVLITIWLSVFAFYSYMIK